MQLSEILTRFQDPKRTGTGYQVRCPVHDDKTASLSVSNGGGKILMHCHAGCSTESIVGAIGLRMADLFCEPKVQQPSDAPKSFKGSAVVACYEYRDADGNVSYRVLRTANKDFVQQRLDDSGQWIWKGPEKKLLYRLPELLADDSDQPVFITEGEKDVDNLRRLGLLATCNSGGAGKFTQDNAPLAGRIVVILPDNDEPGRAHAGDVARRLNGIAARVITVDLAGLGAKGDVSDWIAAGGTRDELLRLVDEALNPGPVKTGDRFAPSSTLIRPKELSMMGLASRFHAKYFETTRYVEARGAFFSYEDGVWHQSRCLAEVKTKQVINDFHEEVDEAEEKYAKLQKRQGAGDQTVLKEMAEIMSYLEPAHKFLPKTKTPGTMGAILDFAKSDLLIGADDFDPDHTLFNCANGSVELETGKFRPHRSTDLCSMKSGVDYEAGADCPRWRRFLEEIFLGDQEIIDFIQRAIGYSMSAETSEQVFLILHGAGSNGKSELFFILNQIFGSYTRSANVDTFMDDRPNGGHNEDIARLRGARLVLTSETEKSKRLAEALVKRLTGQETITASFKHERSFEFMPRFKIWLAANHKPVIQGTDYGIWRRILLVPFNAKFVKPGVDLAENHFRIDPNLRRDLLDELPGILNWGIEGFRKWREMGLAAPAAVRAASEGYREESDRLGAFLSEEMIEGDGLTASLASTYQAYSSWCENGGMKPGTIRTLASDLRGRGVEVRKFGVKCVMSLIGYGLKQED